MLGGLNVQYLHQEIDVSWYSRQCSRYIRNIVRESDHAIAIDFNFRFWVDSREQQDRSCVGPSLGPTVAQKHLAWHKVSVAH